MIPGQGRRGDTPSRILDVAERLVETKGFGSFSYASVAAELNITKAALHYHYPGKAELGVALIARYAARFRDAIAAIDARGGTPAEKLSSYINLYAGFLGQQKMCLCCMLAAEFENLPAPMRAGVTRFLEDNERWLETVMEQAATERAARENYKRLPGDAHGSAVLFLCALEGAMVVGRPVGDPGTFMAVASTLVANLTGVTGGAAAAAGNAGGPVAGSRTSRTTRT